MKEGFVLCLLHFVFLLLVQVHYISIPPDQVRLQDRSYILPKLLNCIKMLKDRLKVNKILLLLITPPLPN